MCLKKPDQSQKFLELILNCKDLVNFLSLATLILLGFSRVEISVHPRMYLKKPGSIPESFGGNLELE